MTISTMSTKSTTKSTKTGRRKRQKHIKKSVLFFCLENCEKFLCLPGRTSSLSAQSLLNYAAARLAKLKERRYERLCGVAATCYRWGHDSRIGSCNGETRKNTHRDHALKGFFLTIQTTVHSFTKQKSNMELIEFLQFPCLYFIHRLHLLLYQLIQLFLSTRKWN